MPIPNRNWHIPFPVLVQNFCMTRLKAPENGQFCSGFKERIDNPAPQTGTDISAERFTEGTEGAADRLADLPPDCPGGCAG